MTTTTQALRLKAGELSAQEVEQTFGRLESNAGRYASEYIQSVFVTPVQLAEGPGVSRIGVGVARDGVYALMVLTELPDNPGLPILYFRDEVIARLMAIHPQLVDVELAHLTVAVEQNIRGLPVSTRVN